MALTTAIAASTYVAYTNGQEQKTAAERAGKQAQDNASKQAAQADQDMNRVNQKRPDAAAILSAAQQSGRGGVSGTMLTGPQGVDPSALNLGKNTLLGM